MPLVLKGLSKLIFVDIALDRQKDNPQRIFESLNSTGLELSQADLIRNYILMGLNREDQERIYTQYWEPIENNAKIDETNQSQVSDFIRDYLTLKNKEIPNKGAVYEKFKVKYNEPNSSILREALQELRTFSFVYTKLLNPEKESDRAVRIELSYIKRLEINVSFPFLMKVFLDYQNSIITKEIFVEILNLVQTFVWRRSVVGLPTSALNKIFMSLYDRIDPSEYLLTFQRSLMQRSGTQRFPRDAEVVMHLKDKDMYNTKPKTRMYFFDKIENYNNKEIVNIFDNQAITIEHIFPQNPNSEWRESLGKDEFDLIRDKYLNTVGNLTLSGNNGHLGNRSFLAKREMNEDNKEQGYLYSRLWLNRDLQKLQTWDVENIIKRADRICQRAIDVWSEPKIITDRDGEIGEVSIFDADDPTNRKLEFAIFFGKRVNKRNITDLYQHIFSRLIDKAPDSLIGTEIGARLGISQTRTPLRDPIQISENIYIETNISSKTKFDRVKLALTTLDIEDELLIKYEE